MNSKAGLNNVFYNQCPFWERNVVGRGLSGLGQDGGSQQLSELL